MSGFTPGRFLRRAPRWRLGLTGGALIGYTAGWLLASWPAGLFAAIAFGALIAFADIGTRYASGRNDGGDGIASDDDSGGAGDGD